MLTLIYLYNSKMRKDLDGKDWSILDDIFLKVLNELQFGYVTTYVIDCAANHTSYDPKEMYKYLCEERVRHDPPQFTPLFTLYKPPDVSINPYTGKKNPVAAVPYSSKQIGDGDIKKWITDNIPDYTQRL